MGVFGKDMRKARREKGRGIGKGVETHAYG